MKKILLTIFITLTSNATYAGLSIVVEAPELIASQSDMGGKAIADVALHCHESGKSLICYTGNADTYRSEAADLELINFDSSSPKVIGIGNSGDTDECGAWLMSVERWNNKVIGYYHGESNCDYNVGQTNMRVHFSESNNNGRTFNRINNTPQVLAQISDLNFPDSSTAGLPPRFGIGNFSTYKIDDEIFFYGQEYPYRKTIPFKTNGNYDQLIGWNDQEVSHDKWNFPLLTTGYDRLNEIKNEQSDGKRAAIQNYATSVAFRRNQKVSAVVSTQRTPSEISFFSIDGVDTPSQIATLVIAENNWQQRDENSLDLIAYPSIVSLDGGQWFENSFYLYYTYVAGGATYANRHIARSKIRVVDATFNKAVSELAVYTGGSDEWVTSKLPVSALANRTYNKDRKLGYIYNQDQVSRKPLYDNYAVSLGSHLLNTSNNINAGKERRLLGYIERSPTASATHALIRTWNGITHSAITKPHSQVEGSDYVLGYIEK